jgi:soluble lytic murein transglycosylase-like protein
MRWDQEVAAAVARWAPIYGITLPTSDAHALVHAVIQRESSHGTVLTTVEPGNHLSFGPMNVLDTTATSLGAKVPSSLTNPAVGIDYGTRYLFQQLRRYGGRIADALAAYNAGSARRDAQGRYINSKGSTVVQGYVDRVLGYWNTYKRSVVQVATRAAPAAGLVIAGVVVLWLASRRRRAA